MRIFDPEFGMQLRYFKGGGGGGSGAVSYPDYMEDWHEQALNDGGVDTLSTSITDVMNAAMGNSPWTGQVAYDPDGDITQMINTAGDLQTLVDLLSTGTSLDTLIANILDTTRVQDSIDAYAVDLDARLMSEILPRFERGMQDINAVTSSAFAIGRALIEQNQDRQVAKYSADLNMKAFSDDAIKVIGMKLEYQRVATATLAEIYRMKIVAKKEENETAMDIDDKDSKWDLELFAYGGNLLAAIGGGTVGTQKPSPLASAIGGALSGAAAGAMVGAEMGAGGGPWGAAIGGVLGAAAGLLG